MKYQKKEGKGYSLYLIKNKEFHTINIRICFTEKVDKRKVTEHNVLTSMMTYATKKYPTREKLLHYCEDLYSLSPDSYAFRYGNLLLTHFDLSSIDSMYLNSHNLYDNLLLLKEIVLNPLVNKDSFNEKYLQIIKENLLHETKAIKEEPRLLANKLMYEAMDKDANYTLTGFCDEQILQGITGQSLYASYQEMINNSQIDIFISGNIRDEKQTMQMVENIFDFHKQEPKQLNAEIYHTVRKSKPSVFQKEMSISQSKLCLGYKVYTKDFNETRYVMSIFNSLLGDDANSLLMQVVREKHNMCYYIGSFVNKLDHLLVINAGINKDNYDMVCHLISECIKKLQEGKFSIKDLNSAKKSYLTDLERNLDNNFYINNYVYGLEVLKSEDMRKRKEKIKEITKEDVMNLAKKVNLDTIFFLKGEINDL